VLRNGVSGFAFGAAKYDIPILALSAGATTSGALGTIIPSHVVLLITMICSAISVQIMT
jgi:hypothetical protein